jgi:hypothetical protein
LLVQRDDRAPGVLDEREVRLVGEAGVVSAGREGQRLEQGATCDESVATATRPTYIARQLHHAHLAATKITSSATDQKTNQ